MTINLDRYVDHLLYTQGKLTLSGLGSIMMERIPAFISDDHKEIFPPRSKFTFIDKEVDAHQLAEAIAFGDGIEMKEAVSVEHQWVEQLSNELRTNKIVRLGGIGFLEEKENKLVFTPSIQSLDQVYYGLPTLPLNPLVQNPVAIDPSLAGVAVTHKDDDRFEWLTYLGALVLGAAMILAYNYFIGPFPSHSGVASAAIERIASPEVGFKPDSDPVDEKTLNESNINPGASDDPSEEVAVLDNVNENIALDSSEMILAQPDENTECIIIIGVFTRTINAIKLSDRLKEDGYNPYLENINDSQRVGIRFKCTNQNLEKMITGIRKKYNSKAWYLVPQISI